MKSIHYVKELRDLLWQVCLPLRFAHKILLFITKDLCLIYHVLGTG